MNHVTTHNILGRCAIYFHMGMAYIISAALLVDHELSDQLWTGTYIAALGVIGWIVRGGFTRNEKRHARAEDELKLINVRIARLEVEVEIGTRIERLAGAIETMAREIEETSRAIKALAERRTNPRG